MTVSSQTSTATFVGNGVATAFPLPFRFFDNGDIRAYFIDSVTGAATQMVLGTDYTLIGAGEPEVDGNALSLLTTTVPLASMRGLYVERVMQQVQETDIVNQGQFFASTHEDVFDRLTMLIQQSNTNSAGAIRVAIGDPEPSRLVSAAQRANLLLSFDSLGNPVVVAPVAGSATDLELRLANDTDPNLGAAKIGRATVSVNSVHSLLTAKRDTSQQVKVLAYHPDYRANVTPAYTGSGGVFVWLPSVPKSLHNGGNVISPTVPWDGSQSGLSDFLAGTGETLPAGFGCWAIINAESLDIAQFGAVPEVGVDNATSLAKAFSVCGLGKVPLTAPKGIFEYSGTLDIDYPELKFSGASMMLTVFKCTSAGVAVAALGARPNRNEFSVNQWLEHFTVEGNALTTILFQYRLNFSSLLNINVREASEVAGIGFSFEGAVSCVMYKLSCGYNMNEMTDFPWRGMQFDVDPADGRRASNNLIIEPQIDHLSGDGIVLIAADNNSFVGGAAQANAGINFVVQANCHTTSARDMGFEHAQATGQEDCFINGVDSKIINCYGTEGFVFGPASERTLLQGGRWHNVTAADTALYPSIDGVSYNWYPAAGPGSKPAGSLLITSCPTFKYKNIKNANGGVYVYPVTAPRSLTVGASPFIYDNSSGMPEDIYFSSGGTSLTVRRSGVDLFTIGVPTGGTFRKTDPGNGFTLVHTVAPFISRITDHRM